MRALAESQAAVLRVLRAPAPHEWLLRTLLVAVTDHCRRLMDDAFIYSASLRVKRISVGSGA